MSRLPLPRRLALPPTAALALAAALLLSACSSDASDPTRSTELGSEQRLEVVSDSAFDARVAAIRSHSAISRAERHVIRDEAAWRTFWRRAVWGGTAPLPEVDFSRHAVVVVAMGARPTGGYWVDIERVLVGARALRVEALASSPGRECIVTMATTAPLDAVLVERTGLPATFDVRDVVRDCR